MRFAKGGGVWILHSYRSCLSQVGIDVSSIV